MKIINPLLCVFFVSCVAKQQQLVLPVVPPAAPAVTVNYDSCKNAITSIKKKNRDAWKKLSKPGREKIFTDAITKTIIPGWIGTKWDFNGTSETPGQGAIACGYFVTTVLRDAGLNLARIKLAQCASEKMLTSLIQPKYIQRFSNVALENFIAVVQKQGYGLYLVGLDNHTGFIYNDGAMIYFIHSTFVGTRNVQKEQAATSWVLRQSKYKVLGKLSADEKVLERWMREL
jgi:hypothetical protein